MSKFSADLKRGHAGEALWLANNPELTHLNGREADFIDYMTGATFEVKTDYYSMLQTPNLFMELYSSAGKLGGPFQAWSKGITNYVYIYWPEKIALTFKVDELVYLVATYAEQHPECRFNVENASWTTVGARIPRAALKGFYTERKLA